MTIDFAIILLGILAILLGVQVMADAWTDEVTREAREAATSVEATDEIDGGK